MKVLALCAAAVLTLVACGSESGDDGDTAASEAEGEGGTSLSDADLTPSPISDLLGEQGFNTDPEESQRRYDEEEQVRQEAVAACMADLGFEYVAWVDPQMFTATGDPDGLEWGSKAWTEKYGYGVTTQWFSQDAVGPDLVGYDYETNIESDDPNQAIVEALPEAEQEAYNTALWGDQTAIPEVDDSMTEEEMEAVWDSYEPSGCYSEASDTEESARTMEFYETYSDDMEQMWEQVQADPRIVEYQAGIESCVSEKGLEYVANEKYWEEMDPIYQELSAEVTYPGADLTEEDMAAMSDDELNELYSQPEILTDEAKEQLAELQAAEIELAVAAYDCGGGDQVAYAELYTEVQADLEQAWLDEHPEVVEQFSAG